MQSQFAKNTVSILIEEAVVGESVNAFELGYFLYYFRAAYVACLETIDFKEVSQEQVAALVNKNLLITRSHDISRLWLKDLPEEFDLEFESISKQSPLQFVAKAAGVSLVALTMAVIISGGEANVYTGEFKLPSIAHVIRQLKDAFGQQPPRALPSERRSPSQQPANRPEEPRGSQETPDN
jgi:hypothetical protein